MTSPHKHLKHAKKYASNADLASRLREWGEDYGLEEDPYLEGISNAIETGKNLAVWASNDAMTLMPHPIIDTNEGAIYSALVLMRNVLVFVPVALTWLAVGKATTAFTIYTATNGAASVVNFLQFWQNGYHILSQVWTLSHIAEDDFYIIATVILLTFVTPFMNRSAAKRSARFEHQAMRERLALVIEVESFFFDKRQITPLSMDSALANSFEEVEKFETDRIEQVAHNLDLISNRVGTIIETLPRGSHARKELKKLFNDLVETRSDLVSLQAKSNKNQKKLVNNQDWKAAKGEAERNRAKSKFKRSRKTFSNSFEDE